MKYTLASVLSFILLSHLCHAQGLYARAGVGYAIPLAGQTINSNTGDPFAGDMNVRVDTFGTPKVSFDLNRISFSAGVQGTLGLGYMLNKNIGIELDAFLGLAPRKYNFEYKKIEEVDTTSVNAEATQYASLPFILAPSFVLQAGENKLRFYTRMGIAIPLSGKIIYKLDWNEDAAPGNNTAIHDVVTTELKTSFGLGFAGAVGARYNIGTNIDLWAEVSALALSLYAKEEDITEYKRNGSNVIGFLSPDYIHREYKKTADGSATNTYPAFSVPYGNASINVGITANL